MAPPQRPASVAEPDDIQRALAMLEWWFHGCDDGGIIAATHEAGLKWPSDFADVGRLETLGPLVAGYGAMFPTYVRLSTMTAVPPKGGRGGDLDTHQLPGLYADVDGAHGFHATEDPLPESLEVVRRLLVDLPEPSVTVETGGGWHLYWKCTRPLSAEVAADAQKRWAEAINARIAGAGYHFDKLGDLARVLRWPGTYNTKGGERRPVTVLQGTGELHDIDALLAHAPELEVVAPPAAGTGTRDKIDQGDPLDALRAMGHAGHQLAARAIVDADPRWTITADDGTLVDLVRPGGSSQRSIRFGGEHPNTGDDMTGQAYAFSHAIPGVEGQKGDTVGGMLAAILFEGDINRCREWLAEQGVGLPWEERRRGSWLDPTEYLEGCRAALASARTTHLPESFWTARPELAHIREAARSRIVPPDAVLGCVLARVAAACEHTLTIPGFAGKPMGLTFLSAIVGPSGAGKSSAMACAADLIPVPPTVLDRLPIGSGEGMVDVLFDDVKEPRDDGKGERTVRKQTRHAAIFEVDEGQVVAELGARSGATLLTTLRTAFSHGTLGQTNASKERQRRLPGETYVFGFVIGLQPEHAVALLDDAAGGTPQRLAWFSATDPDAASGHRWPGQLNWTQPQLHADRRDPYSVRWVRYLIGFDPTIEAGVIAEAVSKMRGEHVVDGLDSHRTVIRLKVAALLALLAGRVDVNVDDWALSGDVMDCSKAVRTDVQLAHRRRLQDVEESTVERQVRKQRALEDDAERRAFERAVAALVKRAQRHAGDPIAADHGDGKNGCSRRCFTLVLNSRSRQHLDAAIEEAVDRRLLTPVGDRWVPGEVQT